MTDPQPPQDPLPLELEDGDGEHPTIDPADYVDADGFPPADEGDV